MTEARVVALPTYDVTVGVGLLDRIGEIVRAAAPARRYAIVTDSNVGGIYAARVARAIGTDRATTFTIPAGESHKTRDSWTRVTDDLLGERFGRDSAVIALGGGVIGDLAGFVAATFMRGIPFVQVPTTLLAMVDASVGGKTGVDTPAGKNLVGAFHQPAAVVGDIATLLTLPIAQLKAGMAEAVKHGVIADADYFDAVAAASSDIQGLDVMSETMLDLVSRSVEIKADVVRRDERESGVRKTLNFGHTIGHAVEQLSGYSLLHGESIALGMVAESRIAEKLGLAEQGTASRVESVVRALGHPTRLPSSMDGDAVIAATHGDKKARAGRVEYALPTRIGAMAGGDAGWSIAVPDGVARAAIA